jgi:hypothetical protein
MWVRMRREEVQRVFSGEKKRERCGTAVSVGTCEQRVVIYLFIYFGEI